MVKVRDVVNIVKVNVQPNPIQNLATLKQC